MRNPSNDHLWITNTSAADCPLKSIVNEPPMKTIAMKPSIQTVTSRATLSRSLVMMMGSVYEKKNDLSKAQSSYEKALQVKPDDPLASNNLAYILLETNRNPDLALRLAQTARRGKPELSNVADTLGWAFYQKGIYESAISMFQEAIKLGAKYKEPESATYHYHLGLAYAHAAQPTLAKQHLERVLKINPNYSDADDVKKQLAQLRS